MNQFPLTLLLVILHVSGTLGGLLVILGDLIQPDPLNYLRGTVYLLVFFQSLTTVLLLVSGNPWVKNGLLWGKLVLLVLLTYTVEGWTEGGLLFALVFSIEAGLLASGGLGVFFCSMAFLGVMFPGVVEPILGVNILVSRTQNFDGINGIHFVGLMMFMVLSCSAGVFWRRYGQIKLDYGLQELSLGKLSDFNLQLQTYARRADEQSAERERQRISREIHDISGYIFTNLLALMDAAMSMGPKADHQKLSSVLFTARKQAQEGLKETRLALRKLREVDPSVDQGLRVIHKIASIFQQVTGTQVELSFGNLPLSFDSTLNRSLYRIVQESLTNAIRHGKASEVRLQFWIHEEQLIVTIHDNGLGAKEITKGIGLMGMEERVENLGGSILAGNAPEGGFTITIRIPLIQQGSTYRAKWNEAKGITPG